MLPAAAQLFEKLPRFLRRHKLMTAWMKLTGEDPLQLVRIRDKWFGYADMRDGFLRLIVIDQAFESEFFAIADSLLKNGGVFFDVGANHGLLSFGLAGLHGPAINFHLFEPNSVLVGSIEKTGTLYPDMQCTVIQKAVADRLGVVGFAVNTSHTGVSHIDADADMAVPVVTLDSYLDEHGINTVNLIKIDIEGYELLALRGAEASLRSRRIQAVYFEFFEKWLVRVGDPAEVMGFLDSVGFVTCFCRMDDLDSRGGPTHTLAEGLPGHGLPLLPIEGHARSPTTDLLALPREHLASLSPVLG